MAMDFELIKVRAIAFLYQAGSFIALAVIGALISPEFRDIVTQHAGDGTIGFIILSAFDAAVKHVRNLQVIKTAERVGGPGARSRVIIV